ncbi:MAG: M3 family metallopeptidase, partial [Muribaculaceae bacterium]|nr:M3 family metallopeptidase [Muribaculaceae bacterium]
MDHNPLTQPFNTPYGAVPFDKITVETYEPAFKEGIKAHEKEINNIINDPNTPTFDNTIVAMEHSGSMLNQIAHVFFAMLSADATQELNDVATKIIPILTEHETNIILNEKLWQRVKFVKENIDSEELDTEDKMLLNKAYKAFVRNGANLNEEQKKRFRELTKRLSEITHLFSQNLLKATSQFEMWLDESDLEGLPQRAINMAKQAAQNKGNNDKYLINLSAPSYRDFMKYSSRRDLREKLYKAYNSKCVDGELSNIKILEEIATIRLNLAQLLGYESFAHYQLEETMATDITHVMQLLNNLKDAYMPAQVREIEEVTDFASKQDPSITKLMPWDYRYYSYKLRKQLFDYDDEQLRPYFPLNNVIDGVFALATKLYSITFKQTENVPVFNPKVKVYEVNDSDGSFLGLLYCDFFPRDTKQSGAWMTSFKQQHGDHRPHVTLTMNFTPPTQQQQSLLSLGEVRTFLHEFGHALHSLFSKCKYESLSGTSVYRDFVELPSQFNENFIFETEFLNSFA